MDMGIGERNCECAADYLKDYLAMVNRPLVYYPRFIHRQKFNLSLYQQLITREVDGSQRPYTEVISPCALVSPRERAVRRAPRGGARALHRTPSVTNL
ncbi:hypothetical protein EVAR_340_1 [Eumeta japonica]|uniref:Uncharacterized protein n=1 Tax=Eumeta variegata TaxID=151549 RepID=A0A4C1SCW9_EUMVA|nr:hypothetical protein EVAR_340_1 [Eumeta japonica]